MKSRKFKIGIAFLTLVCLVLTVYFVKGITSEKAAAAEETQRNLITVTGTGIVKVKPDIAYVNIGVETRNADAKKAQQENARTMDNVMQKIKSYGIKEEDIKTISYNFYPVERYDKETGKSSVYEYRAVNRVEVTVRDIDKLGTLIDGVASVGSNTISGIRFGIADTEKYYNQALEKAVKNAAGKGEAIAAALGVKLKGAVSVQETSYGGPVIMRDYAKMKAPEGYGTTPISSGDLEITASVSVQYDY